MNDDIRMLGIVIVVVVVVASIVLAVAKRLIFAQMEASFRTGMFERCLELLDHPVTRLVFPLYNRLYLSLNALEALDRTEEAKAVVERLLGLRCSKEQRRAAVARAFSLYVEQGDRAGATEMLKLIRTYPDEEFVRQSEQVFAIHFKKDSSYIKQMEAALDGASLGEQTRLCYLLSIQYQNRGDEERAKEYLRRAVKGFAPEGSGVEVEVDDEGDGDGADGAADGAADVPTDKTE